MNNFIRLVITREDWDCLAMPAECDGIVPIYSARLMEPEQPGSGQPFANRLNRMPESW
jgi:hypothetical protein